MLALPPPQRCVQSAQSAWLFCNTAGSLLPREAKASRFQEPRRRNLTGLPFTHAGARVVQALHRTGSGDGSTTAEERSSRPQIRLRSQALLTAYRSGGSFHCRGARFQLQCVAFARAAGFTFRLRGGIQPAGLRIFYAMGGGLVLLFRLGGGMNELLGIKPLRK